jgi:hypothetical protein
MRRAERNTDRIVDLAILGQTVSRSRAGAGDSRSFHVLPSAIPEYIEDEQTQPMEIPT